MSIVGQNFDFLFKMVVIGDSAVGKTNLLSRFEKNQFTYESKATIGVEFATKTINLENARIKTQIWDTAGQERYRAITQAYYKGASGALIVFDLTRRGTYENIPKWIKQLRENTQEGMVCILVGNKCDKEEERCIKLQEVVEFAHENKLFYLETSALNGNNVEKAFMTVIKEIYDELKKKNKNVPVPNKKNQVVFAKKLDISGEKKSKKCCQ